MYVCEYSFAFVKQQTKIFSMKKEKILTLKIHQTWRERKKSSSKKWYAKKYILSVQKKVLGFDKKQCADLQGNFEYNFKLVFFFVFILQSQQMSRTTPSGIKPTFDTGSINLCSKWTSSMLVIVSNTLI